MVAQREEEREESARVNCRKGFPSAPEVDIRQFRGPANTLGIIIYIRSRTCYIVRELCARICRCIFIIFYFTIYKL